WSTWCVPCESEHDLLQQAAARWANQARFVGVVYQDSAEAVRDYLKENGSAYEQLLDDASRCAIDYGVAGVPETFFIDAHGVVRHKQVGPLTHETLAQVFVTLLGAAP